MKRFLLTLGFVAVVALRGGSLDELATTPQLWPAEVTVTANARATVLEDGRPAGAMLLGAGRSLVVTAISAEGITGRIGRATVRVAADKTDLWQRVSAPPPVAPAAAPAPAASAKPLSVAAAPATAAPVRPRVPPTRMETLLQGKLISLAGGRVVPYDARRLNGVAFYGLYFSASWCGPCREFTPELISDYAAIKAVYPEFELVLVSWDRSESDQHAYMRDDAMPWPALRFSERRLAEIALHAGSGIPCLVLVDGEGKELSHSYRWGRYVGPREVVEDTWKILKEARRRSAAK